MCLDWHVVWRLALASSISWIVGLVIGFTIRIAILPHRRKADPIFTAYQWHHPAFWFFTVKDAQLENDVQLISDLFATHGLRLKPPKIRRIRGFLPMGRLLGSYHVLHGVILITDSIARGAEGDRLFVVGHEMGHYFDLKGGRQGHPLFDIIRDSSSELFAHFVGFYVVMAFKKDHLFESPKIREVISKVFPGG